MKKISLLIFLFVFSFSLFGQLNIYYSDTQNDAIIRLAIKGNDKSVAVPGFSTPRGLHVDYENGVLFFADGYNQQIVKADLNGFNVENLTFVNKPIDVYLDKGNQVLYFNDNSLGSIYKMKTDGTDKIELISNVSDLAFVEVDEIFEYLYFASSTTDYSTIYRTDLNGQDIELVYEDAIKLVGIVIDDIQQKMYLLDRTNNVITKVDLENGNTQNIVTTGSFNYALELDEINQILYWGEKIEKRIMRCDTDGGNKELFYEDVHEMGGIAIDLNNICQKYETVYDTIAVTDTLFIDVIFTNDMNLTKSKVIKLYPNPTKDILTIEVGDSYEDIVDYKFEIIDVGGSVISNNNFDSKIFTFNINNDFMKPGMYFVKILNPEGSIIDIKKLILE